MATFQNDYEDQGTGNSQPGENKGQNPSVNARQEGWDNNTPGATAENDDNELIPTVTPDNDNGIAGPDDLVDNNRIFGAMEPEDAGYSPDEDERDDDDLDDDDDDETLIPVETEDDEDDDLDLDDDDDDLDPLADRPTTFEVDPDFASRDHGRVTGTMIDHEPGLPGSGNSRDYNL